MLDILRATKRFSLPSGEELTVLSEVTLSFSEGRSYAVEGPSGSGKSTLLALLAGLERPTSGSVTFQGESLTTASEEALARFRARNVGFMFQAFHLLQHFSALGNVMVAAEIAGLQNPREAARTALEMVGMSHRLGHLPTELSGGEQQRVALARAVVGRPRLLLCDEPTGNLDSENAERVLDLLVRLQRDVGASLILVTHDANIAARMEKRVRLERGMVVEGGR